MDTDTGNDPQGKQMEEPSTSSAQVLSPHTPIRPEHTIRRPHTSSSIEVRGAKLVVILTFTLGPPWVMP